MTVSAERRGPSFWSELYWFVALSLAGLTVAILVLPPRVASTVQLLRQERAALTSLREIEEREDILEGAASAMENDPFYREGVFRKRLGLKKANEEYLEPPAPSIR